MNCVYSSPVMYLDFVLGFIMFVFVIDTKYFLEQADYFYNKLV